MMDFIYVGLFWALVAETLIFLLLTMPSPRGFKGKFVNFLSSNQLIGKLMLVHLILCVLAVFFYVDLSQSEKHFLSEKDKLKGDVSRHLGTELRLGFLSYTVLKVQRNKYITFMLVYVSIALNLYIRLLRHTYTKREKLEGLGLLPKPVKRESEKVEGHSITSAGDRDSKKSS